MLLEQEHSEISKSQAYSANQYPKYLIITCMQLSITQTTTLRVVDIMAQQLF